MSDSSDFFGGAAGAPVGSYATGNLWGSDEYLPLDGRTYLKADYPELDTRAMLTFGANTATTIQTLPGSVPYRIVAGGSMIIAHTTGASQAYYTSTDAGLTWTARTAPSAFGTSWRIGYANGVWFQFRRDAQTTRIDTSPDGINWTQRTIPNLRITAVGYVNGQYILIHGYDSSQLYIIRSTDLATWTAATVPSQGFGGNAGTFMPDKTSLITHPTHGLVFSVLLPSVCTVVSTLDGVKFSTRWGRYQTRSSEAAVTRHIEVTELGEFIATYEDTGVYYRGQDPGRLFSVEQNQPAAGDNTGYGMAHGYMNMMYHTSSASYSSNLVSEDFGRTTKNVGLTAAAGSAYTCVTPDCLLRCTSGGVLQRVAIDTTRFAAVANTSNFQDYNVPIFIKAR